MLQPIATPSHTSPQWTVTNPTLVAPRPLRYPTLVAPHPLRPSAHYHPYQPPRHTRVPPRLRVVPSPAEALARISLIDHPTPPPEAPDEGPQKYGTVSTLSSETLEEFLRILRNGGGMASPVQTPETQPVITDCVTSASPGSALASAPAVWDRRDVSRTPDAPVPSTAPILPAPEWVGRSAHASSCVIRKRTRTQSQSPTRDHDRWSHPYRRDTGSRTGSEKSNKRGSSFCEPTLVRPSPRRSASKRASASSWASSETDVSEPADLGSSQNEDVDVELASNRGDVDDEELLTRSADTELDSSTCEDAPKTHSVRGRMSCTPASPISRKHTSNPLAHYSPMLFETLAARARANAFSPSHSRSPSPTPAPHIPDPLDDEEDGDLDEYQPESVVRMEMPRSSQSPPSTP